ncbi:hypothetical protein [Kitasatospora sp. NBC_01300]|uniref:hypothetical protein n=1 Tax=Kitasatospora sp. NBC_01300 TaxID=2903574 RepID=UPI00352DBA5A|nr:hypothetical protein OG556_18445 [Kitasatospora sp. NBC_01300]
MSGRRPLVEDRVDRPVQLALDGTVHPYPTTSLPPVRRRRPPRPPVEDVVDPMPGQLDALS